MADLGEQRSLTESWDRLVEIPTAFGPQLETLLRGLLVSEGVAIHTVNHRVKARTSAERKVNAKRDRYSGVADLHDILGVRVITYFSDEVDAVAEIIEREFATDAENSVDKGAALGTSQFGYRSHHFVATLNEARAALPEYRRFSKCRFEVQIRSILQHAWAEVEHDLGYKSPVSMPPQIRRRFSRLAGTLEIADDEFVSLRRAIATHADEVSAAVERGDENVAIDRESLLAYVAKSETLRTIDLRIFEALETAPERITAEYAEGRLEEMENLGLHTLDQLEDRLAAKADDVVDLAVEWLSSKTPSGYFRRDEDEGVMEIQDPPESYDDYEPDGWDVTAGRWVRLPRGIGLFYLYLLGLAEDDVANAQQKYAGGWVSDLQAALETARAARLA